MGIHNRHAEAFGDQDFRSQPGRVATVSQPIRAAMSRRMQSFQVPPSGLISAGLVTVWPLARRVVVMAWKAAKFWPGRPVMGRSGKSVSLGFLAGPCPGGTDRCT